MSCSVLAPHQVFLTVLAQPRKGFGRGKFAPGLPGQLAPTCLVQALPPSSSNSYLLPLFLEEGLVICLEFLEIFFGGDLLGHKLLEGGSQCVEEGGGGPIQVVADGIVLVPDSTASCSCSYLTRSWFALHPAAAGENEEQ